MKARSWLFVPADSERKLAKSLSIGADCIIVDLEDAVAADRKPIARAAAAQFLTERDTSHQTDIWVRINPWDSDLAQEDVAAVARYGPAGIVLPKSESVASVAELSNQLDAIEVESGLQEKQIRILAIATETAASLSGLASYSRAPARLWGLTWGAEDLAADLGASRNRDDAGNWRPTFEMARSGCLIAAKAANLEAVDTLHADYSDSAGLERAAVRAKEDGFSGMLAIHPSQVAVINEAFTPSSEEIAHARRLVALFEQSATTGVATLDGKMVDRPHLIQARKILARAGET